MAGKNLYTDEGNMELHYSRILYPDLEHLIPSPTTTIPYNLKIMKSSNTSFSQFIVTKIPSDHKERNFCHYFKI